MSKYSLSLVLIGFHLVDSFFVIVGVGFLKKKFLFYMKIKVLLSYFLNR